MFNVDGIVDQSPRSEIRNKILVGVLNNGHWTNRPDFSSKDFPNVGVLTGLESPQFLVHFQRLLRRQSTGRRRTEATNLLPSTGSWHADANLDRRATPSRYITINSEFGSKVRQL